MTHAHACGKHEKKGRNRGIGIHRMKPILGKIHFSGKHDHPILTDKKQERGGE